MEWQPIETAPKDNHPILLYDSLNDEWSVGCHYGVDYKGQDIWRLAVLDTVWAAWESDPYELTPTHWMSLPEPPKTATTL